MTAVPYLNGADAAHQDLERARNALYAISPDLERSAWVRAGMAAMSAGLTFEDFNDWSAGGGSYDPRACRDAWRSFKPDGGVQAGTLHRMAGESGAWRQAQPARKSSTPARAAGMSPEPVRARCELATSQHHYVMLKNAAGVDLSGLRVVRDDDPLRIAGELMRGSLVVPVIRADGTVSSLQFITPPEVAARLKAQGKPGKLNLPGARLEGWFTVGELVPGGTVYVVEGLGQAWSCWQATGAAAVVCFGAGRMRAVAVELRQRDPAARLIVVADAGMEVEAARLALEVSALVVNMPVGSPKNFDANDLAQRDGGDALVELLEAPTQPEPPPLPLRTMFADELPDDYEAPDELVEGVLTAGAGSVLYGDSNCGKTFVMIDMACAVARGVPWLGRRTEQGAVLYLAAESPASVRGRLQAYQKHHGVRVPGFAITQSPIDLFDGEADTELVIELVRQVEQRLGQKVRLIVGDTLARLSAGANENAAQDMSLVVRRFDRIRTECKAHFCLVHHTGKNAAAGARGWSGVRGAVDTEIEVTELPTGGRCIEAMKQRDLPTRGDRIGFRLDAVVMGLTKWGSPATSCVVVSVDAPDKPKGRRFSEIEGAVVEFLAEQKVGVRKGDVVKHFSRYDKSSVYRSMKSLVKAEAIHEAAGMVVIAKAAK